MAEEDVYVTIDGEKINVTRLVYKCKVISEQNEYYRKECAELTIKFTKAQRLIRKYKAMCERKQKYIERFVSLFGKNWKRKDPEPKAEVKIYYSGNVHFKTVRTK